MFKGFQHWNCINREELLTAPPGVKKGRACLHLSGNVGSLTALAFRLAKKSKVKIKRPMNWGGFFVEINEFEFWQGRSNRLHDRIVFSKSKNSSWEIKRLSP